MLTIGGTALHNSCHVSVRAALHAVEVGGQSQCMSDVLPWDFTLHTPHENAKEL
jgi:hypothetical protein